MVHGCQHLEIRNMRRNQFRRLRRSRHIGEGESKELCPGSQMKKLSRGQSDPRGEELLSGQLRYKLRQGQVQNVETQDYFQFPPAINFNP